MLAPVAWRARASHVSVSTTLFAQIGAAFWRWPSPLRWKFPVSPDAYIRASHAHQNFCPCWNSELLSASRTVAPHAVKVRGVCVACDRRCGSGLQRLHATHDNSTHHPVPGNGGWDTARLRCSPADARHHASGARGAVVRLQQKIGTTHACSAGTLPSLPATWSGSQQQSGASRETP
jgi:hypothetical protein